MLKLGSQGISALRLGGTEIKRAYLGDTLVFGAPDTPTPPDPPEPAAYTITATIDPSGSGTVSGAGAYQTGETVTITAAPGDGYKFTGWQENGVTVSEDEAYTFTVTGNRTLIAVFAVYNPSRLPEGYTEVEYIQAGTALSMNTEITVYPSKTKVILDVDIPEDFTNYSPVFYAGGAAFFYLRRFSSSEKVQGNVGTAAPKLITANAVGRHIIDFDGTSSKMAIDGAIYALNTASTSSAGILYIGKPSTMSYPSVDAKIYSMQIYLLGVLERDFVPCKDPSGVIGLYDLIGTKFYKGGNSTGPAV